MVRSTVTAALFFYFVSVAAFAAQPIIEYELEPAWSISRDEDSRYGFSPSGFYPRELIGVAVDSFGSVFLCDKVSEKLIKLAPGGGEVFAIGSVGEGPEDHRTFGEPIVLPRGRIARADFSMSPKVVYYTADGSFDGSMSFDLKGELSRLYWNGQHWIALASRNDFSGGVLEVSTHLVCLGTAGAVLSEIPLRAENIPSPGTPVNEEKVWTTPRIATAGDGFVFVQRDIYTTRVECLDQNLALVWAIDNEWPLVRRANGAPPDLVFTGNGIVVPAEFKQSIRTMVARSGQEVWIQPFTGNEDYPGTAEFLSFGPGGKPLATIRLIGLPEALGQLKIRGRKLLWIADDDVGADSDETPYIAVFDLVRK